MFLLPELAFYHHPFLASDGVETGVFSGLRRTDEHARGADSREHEDGDALTLNALLQCRDLLLNVFHSRRVANCWRREVWIESSGKGRRAPAPRQKIYLVINRGIVTV